VSEKSVGLAHVDFPRLLFLLFRRLMLQQRAENINRLNIRPRDCAELIGTSVPGQTRSFGDVGSSVRFARKRTRLGHL
jgi:hypothetical protein